MRSQLLPMCTSTKSQLTAMLLPNEHPMRFDFVVNMKTAQALGITFPNEIMLQVTEVIQ